jgi:hypothetical protein
MFALSLFLLLWAAPVQNTTALEAAAYWEEYKPNCLEALKFAEEIKPRLLEALDNDEFLTRVGLAVLFPELSRYSYLRDAIETTTLEFSYLFFDSVDFSIGMLQMKPSFAKMLETSAAPCCRIRFPELFEPAPDERAARGSRLMRLKNPDKQLEYFAVFLRLMRLKFPNIPEQNGEKMVLIFSAAYNAGFDKTLEELEEHSRQYYFPKGKYGGGEQYSYSELALDYYRRR